MTATTTNQAARMHPNLGVLYRVTWDEPRHGEACAYFGGRAAAIEYALRLRATRCLYSRVEVADMPRQWRAISPVHPTPQQHDQGDDDDE